MMPVDNDAVLDCFIFLLLFLLVLFFCIPDSIRAGIVASYETVTWVK